MFIYMHRYMYIYSDDWRRFFLDMCGEEGRREHHTSDYVCLMVFTFSFFSSKDMKNVAFKKGRQTKRIIRV